MTDEQLPPPASPSTTEAVPPWWKKKRAKLPTWAWIAIGAVVAFGAIGALASPDEEEASFEAPTTTETVATTEGATPDTTEAAATTTEAPTTTQAPTTTAAPTTTIDPAVELDFTAISVLGGIRDGTAPEITEAVIADLEPSPLERVDVVSAFLGDDGTANLIIVGTSGYGTDEFQIEATIDALNTLATIWEIESFKGIGNVKIGLDLTVDGRQFFVPNESMLALNARRLTPQQALGLA